MSAPECYTRNVSSTLNYLSMFLFILIQYLFHLIRMSNQTLLKFFLVVSFKYLYNYTTAHSYESLG